MTEENAGACGRPHFYLKKMKKRKKTIDKPFFIIYNIKRSPGY